MTLSKLPMPAWQLGYNSVITLAAQTRFGPTPGAAAPTSPKEKPCNASHQTLRLGSLFLLSVPAHAAMGGLHCCARRRRCHAQMPQSSCRPLLPTLARCTASAVSAAAQP